MEKAYKALREWEKVMFGESLSIFGEETEEVVETVVEEDKELKQLQEKQKQSALLLEASFKQKQLIKKSLEEDKETYKIRLNDQRQYTKENAKKYIGYIKNNLEEREVTIKELFKISEEGKTVRPANCGSKECDWKSQQLFYIDIDDGMSIKEFIKSKYMELNPAFIYTSLSSTKEHNKFRVVFVNEYNVTDYDEAKQILGRLIQYFKVADESCKDLSRIYYGGRKSIEINLNNKLNLEVLFSNTEEEETNKQDMSGVKVLEKRDLKETGFADSLINMDIERCKQIIEKLGMNFNREFISEYDLERFCKTEIDLEELFGLNGTFSCILPDHEDEGGSANFFISGNYDVQLYKCFSSKCPSESQPMNIFDLFEALTGLDTINTQDLIYSLFNVRFRESEEYLKTTRMIRKNRQHLEDETLWIEFKNKYPELSEVFRYGRKAKYLKMLSFAENNMRSENTHEGYCIFYASCERLSEALGVNNKKSVNKIVQLLSAIGLIEKIDIKDVSKGIAKQLKNNQYDRYTNCFMIKPFGYVQLKKMNHRASQMKENNMSMKALSSKHLVSVLGEEETQELYKQKEVSYTDYDKRKMNKYVKAIKTSLKRRNYITQRDCIDVIQLVGSTSMTTAEKEFKTYMNFILEELGMDFIKVNKQNKKDYNLPSKLKSRLAVLARKK